MNARARAARAFARDSIRTRRAQRTAARQVATGLAPVKAHLITRGMAPATAARFAGAFSRGVQPTATGETTIKLKGRRTKRVAVKIYDTATFTARLAVYRPKDPAAAAEFAALAA